jgi:hypothetical protein
VDSDSVKRGRTPLLAFCKTAVGVKPERTLSEKLLKRGSQHADVLAPFWLRFGSVARVFTR